MKKALLLLLSLMASVLPLCAGYEYDLVNMLGDTIVVKINQKRTDNKDNYQIIPGGKTVKQVFNNVYCLERLSWARWDNTAPMNGGMDLVDKTNGRIPEEKQREFGDKLAYHYAFIPMEIEMQPNETFQKTRKAAAELLKGIDYLACQTIDTAKAFSNPLSGGSGTGGDLGLGGGGFGLGGDLGLGDGGLGLGDGGLGMGDSMNLGGGRGSSENKAKTISALTELRNAIASSNKTKTESLVRTNLALLKKHFSDLEIGKIKTGHIKANMDEALGLIDNKLTRLNNVTMLNASNMEQSLMGRSLNLSLDMGMGDGGGNKQKRQCDFGLGKIAKGAGKLAGYTLCKSREFIIYFKVNAEGERVYDKYRRPILTATTVEGQ